MNYRHTGYNLTIIWFIKLTGLEIRRKEKIICMLIMVLVAGGCRNSESKIPENSKQMPNNAIGVGNRRIDRNNFMDKECNIGKVFEGVKETTLSNVIGKTIESLGMNMTLSQCHNNTVMEEIYRYVFYKDNIRQYLSTVLYKKDGRNYQETRWLENSHSKEFKKIVRELDQKQWNELLSVLDENGFWNNLIVVDIKELAESVHSGLCFFEGIKNGKYYFIEKLEDTKRSSSNQTDVLCNFLYQLTMEEKKSALKSMISNQIEETE